MTNKQIDHTTRDGKATVILDLDEDADDTGGSVVKVSGREHADLARRIVACLAALDGISTEAIERDGHGGVRATLEQNIRVMIEMHEALQRVRERRHDPAAIVNAIYVAEKHAPLIRAIKAPKP